MSALESVLREFQEDFQDPLQYLQQHDKPKLSLVKELYDFASEAVPPGEKYGALDNLVVEGLDEESVWQEIALRNEPLLEHMNKCLRRIAGEKKRVRLLEPEESSEEEDEDLDMNKDDEEEVEDSETGQEELGDKEDSDSSAEEEQPVRKKKRVESAVDDKFFKLAEMEEFLKQEDEKEEKRRDRGRPTKNDSFVDYFVDWESESEGSVDESTEKAKSAKRMMYEDFFDPPSEDEADLMSNEETDAKESSSEEDDAHDQSDEAMQSDPNDDEEDEEEEEGAAFSTHEKRKKQIEHQISMLEEANMTEKTWQLRGETTAKQRPENSLLEEDLQFEHRTRQAPVITEETTEKIEDVIKRRIVDQAWDDVERKEKPPERPYNYRKTPVLDQEKSKLGLSEIYEREYLKQTQEKKEEKENPDHQVIKIMMKRLFGKLDSLSNYHFTPKPLKEEVRIVTNAPAITVEEITPATVADATLLAPEELQGKAKGDLVGETERTTTDKKRDRRKKKVVKRAQEKEKEKRKKLVEKLRPGLGNKYSKAAAMKELEKASKKTDRVTLLKGKDGRNKTFKSSTAFFEQLQHQVSGDLAAIAPSRRKPKQKRGQSGEKLKL